MISRSLKKIAIFTIIIGTLAFCINWLYTQIGQNSAITYMETKNINGIIMYKFNFYLYFDNLIYTFRQLPQLNFNFVTYEWQNHAPYDITTLNIAWDDFVHNLGLIANFFILLINILLLPLNMIGYTLQIICGIVGISYFADQTNPLYWLLNIARTITQLNIPYITLN